MNERGPSFASSDFITSRAISFSILKASSYGRPEVRRTASLILRTASGPFCAIVADRSYAFAISFSCGTT